MKPLTHNSKKSWLTTRSVLSAVALLLAMGVSISFAQTTQTFTTSNSFTVPCNVTSITVECWGPGGGGGGDGTNGGNSGSGGGGGGYSTASITVTPNQIIAYTVGTGGSGGSGENNGSAGSAATTFSTVSANAGGGGAFNSGAGGAVGTGTTTNGTIGSVGGAVGGTGGTGGNGGAGGVGASGANGTVGTIPGGGGGGGDDEGGGTSSGGAGARGEIKITYTSSNAGTDQTLASCVTIATLAGNALEAGMTGTWTCITNCTGVSITTPSSPTSGVTGLSPGTATTFRWSITGTCPTATDDVIITAVAAATSSTAPTAPDVRRCGTGTVTLTASGGEVASYLWYDASSGGNLLGTAASYTTPSISTTTPYYVENANLGSETTLDNGITATSASGGKLAIGFNVTNSATTPVIITQVSERFNSLVSGTAITYYRSGTYVGNMTSSTGWTLAGTSPTFTPTSTATPYPMDITDVSIPAGATYGFYIFIDRISCDYNTVSASVSDANIALAAGSVVSSSPTAPFTGGTLTGTATWEGDVYYRVESCISPRTTAQAIVDAAVPSCATGATPASGATGVSLSGTTLSWDAVSTAVTYDVYFDATTNPPTTLASDNQTGTTYNTGALTNGTTYYWRIVPYNSCGVSTGCSDWNFQSVPPAKWSMGASATYVKSNATISKWQANYDGGISTIPASGFWILRKTGAANPGYLVSNGGYYPNLTIESNFGPWTCATLTDSSTFTGATGFPTVKGILDIGGAGSSTVTFLNENTNATLTLVQSNLIVRSGSTLQNYGTGFNVQGNINIIGSLVYDANDSRIIRCTGTAAQTLGGGGTINMYNMGVDKTVEVVALTQNITVDNVLTLVDGAFDLNSFTLILANAATTAVSRTNGYVISETNVANNTSKLQWNIGATTGAHEFPFGTAAGDYIPVTFNNSGESGNVAISTRPTAANTNEPKPAVSNVGAVTNMLGVGDSLSSAIDRWWDITSSAASPLPAVTLSLSYLGAENTMTSVPDRTLELGVQHWNGTSWDDGKGGGDGTVTLSGTNGLTTGANTITVTGQTYFSPRIIVRGGKPLPIELLSFAAVPDKEQKVYLYWQTAAEINNSYFTIERSNDGKEFSVVLDKIPSKAPGGNSSAELSYNAIDKDAKSQTSNLKSEILYYRLKQTDFDGKYTYSGIVAVNLKSEISNLKSLYVYPNPANNKLNIVVADALETAIVKIYALTGQIILENILCNPPAGLCQLEIANLASGVYFVSLNDGENVRYARFVKE